MMMRLFHRLAAGLALLTLAACAGGNGPSTNSQQSSYAELVSALRAQRGQAAPQPTLTRALIDGLTVPSLEIVAESRGRTAYLVPLARRNDALPGQVTIWRTAEGGQVALRDGVITATRGLGRDLASSDVRSTLRGLRGDRSIGQRKLYLRNDLGNQELLRQGCTFEDLGIKDITIVERSFRTRHLRELCVTPGRNVKPNEYWIDPRSGRVWQSRQWLGPNLGYFRTRLLRS